MMARRPAWILIAGPLALSILITGESPQLPLIINHTHLHEHATHQGHHGDEHPITHHSHGHEHKLADLRSSNLHSEYPATVSGGLSTISNWAQPYTSAALAASLPWSIQSDYVLEMVRWNRGPPRISSDYFASYSLRSPPRMV